MSQPSKEAKQNYIKRHPERRKATARNSSHNWRLKNLYHLTPERYKEMYEEQNGVCILPSCGRPIDAIDHDHDSGITRALMCRQHNAALGLFGDNSKLVFEAAEYLRKHGR